jgi:hypothetical protein
MLSVSALPPISRHHLIILETRVEECGEDMGVEVGGEVTAVAGHTSP